MPLARTCGSNAVRWPESFVHSVIKRPLRGLGEHGGVKGGTRLRNARRLCLGDYDLARTRPAASPAYAPLRLAVHVYQRHAEKRLLAIHTTVTPAFRDVGDLVDFAALSMSIVLDFLVKDHRHRRDDPVVAQPAADLDRRL